MAVGKPGGKCARVSVVSSAAHPLVGMRYAPVRANEIAAPTYDAASGSSPGPGGWVAKATSANAAAPANTDATARDRENDATASPLSREPVASPTPAAPSSDP